MRKRPTTKASNQGSDEENDDLSSLSETKPFLLNMSKFLDGGSKVPSALDLMQDAPENPSVRAGFLLKQGWPYHGLLSWIPCCGLDRPIYKRRYFVLRSGYLFRYKNENSTSPKGLPVPIEDATFHTQQSSSDPGDDEENVTMVVRTIRKEYTLRARNQTERDDWLDKMRAAKQWAIKARMGHVKVSPLDRKVLDSGDYLFSKGLKRERKLADGNSEMKFLTSNPGGY
jgi:hypothetical protein